MSPHDTTEITQAFQVFKQNNTVEIRSFMPDGRKLAGYYNQPEVAAKDIVTQLDGSAKAVYSVLNSISDVHLQSGGLKQRSGMVKDHHIIKRDWIFIDIDPERPAKTNATNEEKAAAKNLLEEVLVFLHDVGFPKPILTDSGNGFHAYFRVDLPNSKEIKKLVHDFLKVLDNKFSNDAAKVDITVFNASRITKVPGTMTRKGPHSEERPQRRAHILSVPDEIKALTEDKIRAVAGLLQPSYCKITGTRAEVIAAFNQRYMSAEVLNWYCQREGTRFVSPKSTSGNPGIVILDNGRFYSHHNSDGLSEHSHSAFDALVEYGHNGNDEAGLAKACKLLKMGLKTPTKAAKEAKPATEPPTPPEIPEAVKQEAAEVLKSGHALDFMKTTFHLKHEGDDITAECLALLTACQSVSNATGLHLVLSGEKGEGKSHTVETWLKQIPCAYKLAGSFSDKTLFYRSIATPSIIYIDDRALSEDLNATIKTATSHYQEVTQHFTVSKDRQAVKLSLAARSAFVFSKVDDVGDDQLLDRCLSAWVDSDQVHSRRVTSLTLSRAAAPRNQSKEDNHNEQICQALWTKIKDCEFYVSVPFALRIHFEGFTYRNQGIFLDLIRCYAVLRHPDRNPITADDGVIEITALESDFTQAKDLFSKLMSHHGDQIQKLTPTEGVVIDHIKKHQITVFTISDIQNWIDVSTSQAHGIMNGRSDRGHHYGGLLAKCPAISVARVQSSYETEQKSRRAVTRNVYYVDSETLQRWSRHTQVWLEPLTTLQHACNTLTTRCVVSDSATNQQQPEKQRSYNNNNSHLQHKEKYVQQQGGGVETPPPPDNYTSSCYCNSGVLEEKEKNFISAPNEQNNPHASTNDLQHTVLQACCKQVVVLDAKYDNFTQADFHKLRKPDLQKCSLCGRSTVTYREHCTHENKKRAPARICDRCYAVLPLGGGIQEHLTIPTVSDFHKHSCDNVPCTQCNRICTQAGGAFTDGNTFLCGECLTQATKQNLVEKGVIV